MCIKGLDLCKHFYKEVVQPVLDIVFSGLLYSAAIIGRGSEVLGFDDGSSRDHDWGPRVMLFFSEEDLNQNGDAIQAALKKVIPEVFQGYAVGVRHSPRQLLSLLLYRNNHTTRVCDYLFKLRY